MNAATPVALRRLEQGGIRFELKATGEVAYENTWPGEVPQKWFQPLPAELGANRPELVMILKRRQEWIEVYDEWSERLATEAGDPERDAAYLRRLAAPAKAAGGRRATGVASSI